MAKIPYRTNRPPFGGAGMTRKECLACHTRWGGKLRKRPHRLPKGHPVRRLYEDGHQCGGCTFYTALEGGLGMDWGVCGNPESDFDGRAVFEHHSCLKISERRSHRAVRECPLCYGLGEILCGVCRGTGEVKKRRKN